VRDKKWFGCKKKPQIKKEKKEKPSTKKKNYGKPLKGYVTCSKKRTERHVIAGEPRTLVEAPEKWLGTEC